MTAKLFLLLRFNHRFLVIARSLVIFSRRNKRIGACSGSRGVTGTAGNFGGAFGGPGLGADSIAAGKFAAVIGLFLVAIYMALSYGFFGGLAVAALGINIILIVAALSALQATLTLPGIAGIVLTMGIAVDANVLVFERIREELTKGRSAIAAIDSGYQRAISTITTRI